MEVNNNDWLEVAVFIHGITPHAKVEPHAETHKKFYDRLNAVLGRKNKAAFAGRPIMVEWGWEVRAVTSVISYRLPSRPA